MKLNELLTKERKRDEFLHTITSIFRNTRWLGIPVYGGKRFFCLTIFILVTLVYIEVMAIRKLTGAVNENVRNTGGEQGVIARLSGAIFYANTLISLLLIWRLLRTWTSLSEHWLRVETKGLYVPPDSNIRRRMIFITSFVACCACLEHVLSMVSAIRLNCSPSECFRRYMLNSHNFMLRPSEYNIWVAIPVFVTGKIATILWNFQDLVVILLSMGLASRYHRLNCYVKRYVAYEKKHGKGGSPNLSCIIIWRKLREAYVHQAALVRKVDKELGGLTILCNLNNFFFICLQLFLILREDEGSVLNVTYYIISLGWLMFRASSVILAAADVNLHSKRALASVYKCSSSRYNVEVKRLKYYLTNDDVCLTGLGIFFMNRNTLLEVAAAIVKYELILIHFDT